MSVPIKRNTAGQIVYVVLFDGADIVTTPTIMAGDIQISLDGGAFNNPTILPSETPAASGQVQIPLSQAETNAVHIGIRGIDQAGAEWDDFFYSVFTETQTIGDLSPAFPAGAIEFTYTITNSVSGLPIDDVDVWISTDAAGSNIIWRGQTDVFGVARNALDELPKLDPGTYYFWREKTGFSFSDPDAEVVS